ncbi:alpha/beta fold hydrolase [Altererythrobacter ishigakiensis]|uniref:Alpha/beta hydrolase family protein n=1 Tax=Altererythrobacter ishigakiensis TaxID=476157 RepID=A0A562UVE3_9SPHN|nr:alpha/beta fold hydrolase [Altererythrobacter ishigakiensis]TWJ09604.1 alpha/beta hydrolase family protein [Altererythrobacter ishigakiensis]
MATLAAVEEELDHIARPPSRFWALAEGRAMFELGAFYLTRPFLSQLPKGDGHTVKVLPGFMATNNSTAPMRRLLQDLGYDAHGWDSGRNVRVDNALIERLEAQLQRLNDDSGQKVSLVGWSLGGVLARELAKLHPDRVRLVISLGSPISDDRGHTNARRLFELLNGREPEPLRDGRFQGLDEAPPVPTTSILTKTDGVVHWRGSVQKPTRTPSENIEVYASHLGLGVNPSVMIAIADRLAQPEGDWVPFEPSLAQQWMFPHTGFN